MKTLKEYLNLKILVIAILPPCFQSCKKLINGGGDWPTFTIRGTLYLDSSMQPMKNQKVDLFQTYSSNLGGNQDGGILDETVTDSNGYFKFEFKDAGGLEEQIRIPAGQGYKKLIENIPQNQSISDIKVFNSIHTNFQVYLNIINPHPNTDTLVIANFETNTTMYIPCPLSSGILYTATNYPVLNMAYGENNFKRLTWYFNQYHGDLNEHTFVINKFCNDTVFVTLDIY